MSELTIVVGIGASGKTTYCNRVADETGVRCFSDATLMKDDKTRAGHDTLGEIVARLLGRGENCVMDESHLVSPSFRRLFKEFCDTYLPSVTQRWVFFKNDALACINNAYIDAQKGKFDHCFKSMDNQIDVYEIPPSDGYPGFTLEEVVCPEPHFSSLPEARAWLKAQTKSR